MLSSLIYASTHMIEKGDAKITKIYNGVNAMEEKQDGILSNQELTISGAKGNTQIKIDIYHDEKSGLMSYENTRAASDEGADEKQRRLFHL